ncbi:MAG: putative D-xylose utilization operon transcriptional repressor [Gammaproteobacteria bacterium]|nr:putative D-xylose utilization operon transcriptional repressor [Gammaproteobacteria bacterium]
MSTASAPRSLTKPQARIERIFQSIRRQICLLDFPPGTILREQDLAEQFKVSRTPIRHVLNRLAVDGLVESRQGVGTTVTTIEFKDLIDIYYLRATLAEAIGDSEPLTPAPDVFKALDELAAKCEELGNAVDLRGFGEINIGLHTQILRIIRSRPLRDVSDRLFYQTVRVWFQIVPRFSWERAVLELCQEIQEVRQALARDDLKAVGLVHRNRLSTVMILLHRTLDEESAMAYQLA